MTRQAIVAAAVAAAAAAALLARKPAGGAPAAPDEAAWGRAGEEYAWAISWSGAQSLTLAPGRGDATAVGARADVALVAALRPQAEPGGGHTIALRVLRFERAVLEAAGVDVLSDEGARRAAFEGQEAVLELDPTGRVAAIRFAPGQEALFRGTVEWISRGLQVVGPPHGGDARWRVAQEGPFGLAEVEYERRGATALRSRVLRYERLDAVPGGAPRTGRADVSGSAAIVLDDGGRVASIRRTERLEIRTASDALAFRGEVEFRADLRGRMATAGPRAPTGAAGERRTLGPPVASPAARERVLVAQAAGMTAGDVLSDLLEGRPGRGDLASWMWNATAVLELHPDACGEVAATFATLSPSARALALDLLASVGHADAQAAMRAALASAARSDPAEYPLLLQRLGFLQAPQPESAELLWSVYASSGEDPAVRDASALALGAVAGRLAAVAETRGAATAYADGLRDRLRGSTGAERAVLLRALGNAALAEDVALLRAEASSPDPIVRSAAAIALRNGGLEGAPAVVELLGDPNLAVQASAVGALRRQPLDASVLSAVADLVRARRVHPTLHGALVNVVAPQWSAGRPGARAVLEAVAAATSDAETSARIRSILGR